MDKDIFIDKFSNSFAQHEAIVIRSQIPAGNPNMDFVFVIVYCDKRTFWLRFTFDKISTDCEVLIEEEMGKNDLNHLLAHYPVETEICNIKPSDVPTFDGVMLDIMQKIKDAYQHS